MLGLLTEVVDLHERSPQEIQGDSYSLLVFIPRHLGCSLLALLFQPHIFNFNFVSSSAKVYCTYQLPTWKDVSLMIDNDQSRTSGLLCNLSHTC